MLRLDLDGRGSERKKDRGQTQEKGEDLKVRVVTGGR
jgi:hypothetical protein